MAQLIASRYEVGPLLGTGGMARVVRGRDTRLDRPVAIKLVPADAIDPVGRERFGREARSSAGFAHPNAVTAFDAGESDGFLYLVMELVDGSSLAELLADRAPLPIEQALHIEDSILAALSAAHAAGIVHRDVKPGNVLLGDHGRVKLADFGIARRLDDLTSDLTGVGQFIGTPKYLAPEQLAGEPATPASDLYAAGVVLYEMLAGEPPFDAATPMELAWAHHNAPVPDVRVLRPDVPAPVAATIATAMAKHPTERFATADAMRRSLTLPAIPAGGPPATALLAAPVLPPTVVGPAPGRPAEDGSPPPSGRWRWVVALAALVALVVGAVAVGLARQDNGADPTATTAGTGSGVASETISSATMAAPATTLGPATTAVPTQPPPPATTSPPTAAPSTAEPPTVPGIPSPLDDLLNGGTDVFGTRTNELLDEIAGVQNDPERARRVLEQAEEWVQDGELDVTVLPILNDLLGDVAAQDQDGNSGQGNGNGNDDGGDD